MTMLSDRTRDDGIVVTSPDGTVRVSITAQHGTRFQLSKRGFAALRESTLGEQASRALSQALTTPRHANHERDNADPVSGKPDEHLGRRLLELLLPIDETATSPRGLVSITWRGHSAVKVLVQPRALDRLDLDGLGRELNDALKQVIQKRSKQLIEIHHEIHGHIEPAGILT